MSGHPVFTYNVTQTLKPFFHKHNIHKQHFTIIKNIQKVLDNLYVIHYHIITELTEKGNIHYHMQINSLMIPSQFEQYYSILTKDLGFSQIIEAKTEKQVTGWITYMQKDIQSTLRKMNALSAITTKDIPKEIKDKIILQKHIEIRNIYNISKIISNYNNIYASETIQAQATPSLGTLVL